MPPAAAAGGLRRAPVVFEDVLGSSNGSQKEKFFGKPSKILTGTVCFGVFYLRKPPIDLFWFFLCFLVFLVLLLKSVGIHQPFGFLSVCFVHLQLVPLRHFGPPWFLLHRDLQIEHRSINKQLGPSVERKLKTWQG